MMKKLKAKSGWLIGGWSSPLKICQSVNRNHHPNDLGLKIKTLETTNQMIRLLFLSLEFHHIWKSCCRPIVFDQWRKNSFYDLDIGQPWDIKKLTPPLMYWLNFQLLMASAGPFFGLLISSFINPLLRRVNHEKIPCLLTRYIVSGGRIRSFNHVKSLYHIYIIYSGYRDHLTNVNLPILISCQMSNLDNCNHSRSWNNANLIKFTTVTLTNHHSLCRRIDVVNYDLPRSTNGL